MAYNRAYHKEWVEDNFSSKDELREYWRENTRNHAAQYRLTAIVLLGGKCAKCGIEDERVLTFDHVNNDGYKEGRAGRSTKVIREVVKGTRTDIQLLCANCHMIKTKEYTAIKLREKFKNK